MSLPGGSPVLTLTTDFRSGYDMKLLGVGNCPQMRCNVDHTLNGSNSDYYAEPVQQIIFRWSCTTLVWFYKSQYSAAAHRHNNCTGIKTKSMCLP
jgi:hypothetical protein